MIYVLFNLFISLINTVLIYFKNIQERKVSNEMQFDYVKDNLNINYHYVQDKSILNLKSKSMGINPVFFLPLLGKFIGYAVQFVGIIYIFSVLSPLFLSILLFTSLLSVLLTFKSRKMDFDFKNERVEEDRKIDYIYIVMTDYKFAKEVRMNNAGNFIKNKYNVIIEKQKEKLKKILWKIFANRYFKYSDFYISNRFNVCLFFISSFDRTDNSC